MKKLIPILFLLVLGQFLKAQGEILFDDSNLHEIHFDIVDTTIFINSKDYQMINMTIDGTIIDSIGFKKKGNISATHSNHKFPFKIKTNKYVNGKKYDGIKEFTLHNSFQDPTMLREKMTYDLCNDLGLHSLRAAFAKVYINGNYWGLYTLLEAKDELYKRAFDNNDGAVLESTDFSDMCFKGLNQEDYYHDLLEQNLYILDNGDEQLAWEKFPIMLDKANNSSEEEYMDIVPNFLNVKDFFSYQALNVFLLNFDSYIGFQGNQLYYFDEITDLWEVIPWDFNASFGLWNTNNFRPFDYDLIPSKINNGCIASQINEIPELRNYYLETMCELVNNLADTNRLNTLIDKWKIQIEEAVYDDVRKEFDNALFDQATEYGYFPFAWEEDVPALKTFAKDRWIFINNQLEISNLDCSISTSTHKISRKNELICSPNPIIDLVQINTSIKNNNRIQNVELYSSNGNYIKTFSGNNSHAINLDLSSIESGFYIIQVYLTNQEFIVEKLVKL